LQAGVPEDHRLSGCLPVPDLTVTDTWDPSGLLGIEQVLDNGAVEQLMSDISYDTATGMMTRWTTPAGPIGALSLITHHVTTDGTRARPHEMWAEDQSLATIADLGIFGYDGAGSIKAFGPWTHI
jgi:hypothetical protein